MKKASDRPPPAKKAAPPKEAAAAANPRDELLAAIRGADVGQLKKADERKPDDEKPPSAAPAAPAGPGDMFKELANTLGRRRKALAGDRNDDSAAAGIPPPPIPGQQDKTRTESVVGLSAYLAAKEAAENSGSGSDDDWDD